MKFEPFELAVIELASRGVRLTVPNVAAALRLEPGKAEQWLDRMAYEGRLDVELDEEEGYVFYRVRGLSPMPTTLVPRPTFRMMRAHKSITAGALLGLLVPGLGLVYAAPVSVAAIAAIATLAAVKMLGVLPLFGPILSSIALGIAALTSAVLGALYVKQYNRFGRRTHLGRRDLADHAAAWPTTAASAAAVVESALRQ
jgi:hypothetical protein